MQIITDIIGFINDTMWGIPMLVILLGTHIYVTIRTKFIQRKIWTAIKLSFSNENQEKGDVSQFGALATSLAATIGTGNIIGVGTAIALGGPGALLWMWLAGICGMATKYAESLISVKFRVQTPDGRMLGGAMYALDRGLKMKWLGILFAGFAAVAAFGIGCSVQSNAIATTLHDNFAVPTWATAIVLVILMVVVIFGGVKSISRVCESLVPFMAIGYIICCIGILIVNHTYIGEALLLIIEAAFAPRSVGGGVIGAGVMMALRYGVARGLFSNESGMGSAPIVAASAQTKNPCRQALVSMSATFWDTVVVCALTGLMLVSSMVAHPELFPVNNEGLFMIDGGKLTSVAFGIIPGFGVAFLTVALVLFAFSTILGWSYYGERAAEYLFGAKIITPYRIAYTVIACIGCLVGLGIIWTIADILNALMVLPNIVAIWALMKIINKETQYYVYTGHLDEVDTTPIPVRNQDGSLPESAYQIDEFKDIPSKDTSF